MTIFSRFQMHVFILHFHILSIFYPSSFHTDHPYMYIYIYIHIDYQIQIYLVGGFKRFLFSIVYGMSSSPLTNSYSSRWLLHHQPDIIILLITMIIIN